MVKERATKQPSFIRPYQVQTPRRVRASALTARSEAAAPDAQKTPMNAHTGFVHSGSRQSHSSLVTSLFYMQMS